MTQIEKIFQELANTVIQQAFYDIKHQENKRISPETEVKSAIEFLDNSEDLEFYADLAGIRNDLTNSGFLKPIGVKRC